MLDPGFNPYTQLPAPSEASTRAPNMAKLCGAIFAPEPRTVCDFLFYFTQEMTEADAGDLIVSVTTSSHLEMAWHYM